MTLGYGLRKGTPANHTPATAIALYTSCHDLIVVDDDNDDDRNGYMLELLTLQFIELFLCSFVRVSSMGC